MLISPCISCPFKDRPKTECTKASNYCPKLLEYQRKLDNLDHSIKSTPHEILEYSISNTGKTGAHFYDFS